MTSYQSEFSVYSVAEASPLVRSENDKWNWIRTGCGIRPRADFSRAPNKFLSVRTTCLPCLFWSVSLSTSYSSICCIGLEVFVFEYTGDSWDPTVWGWMKPNMVSWFTDEDRGHRHVRGTECVAYIHNWKKGEVLPNSLLKVYGLTIESLALETQRRGLAGHLLWLFPLPCSFSPEIRSAESLTALKCVLISLLLSDTTLTTWLKTPHTHTHHQITPDVPCSTLSFPQHFSLSNILHNYLWFIICLAQLEFQSTRQGSLSLLICPQQLKQCLAH